jgi:hypothetical protein
MKGQIIERSKQSSISITKTKSWSTLKTWFEQCSKHKMCKSSVQQGFLPHRLIYVGQHISDKPKLKLCYDIEAETRYLTLSHCWGQQSWGRLLHDNLESLQREIPQHFLSKTFQDAIAITRRLGFAYMWIDSLCIIQDSETDWLVESGLMSKIYGNSVCTVAAAAASNGSEGLFLDRTAYTPIRVNLVQGEIKKPFTLHIDSLWVNFVEKSPLSLRAWTYQERMLSPRSLYFDKDQIFWQCGELHACEEWPLGLPQRSYTEPQEYRPNDTKTDLKKDFWHIVQGSKTQSIEEALIVWEMIIRYYTQTYLTYPTDRLVAIGGVASQLHPRIQCRYFAGLWEHQFIKQLLWSTRTLDSSTSSYISANSRPSEYLAPSWSWASLNATVETSKTFNSRYSEVLCVQLIEAHVDLKSQNIFGQVTGGFIRVQGSLAIATLVKGGHQGEHGLTILLSDGCGESNVGRSIDCAWDVEFSTGACDHNSKWHLLLIGKCEELHNGFRSFYADGLILGASGKQLGTFQRHGFFGDPRSRCNFKMFEAGSSYFDTTLEAQQMERCANTRGGYDYTITVL